MSHLAEYFDPAQGENDVQPFLRELSRSASVSGLHLAEDEDDEPQTFYSRCVL